MNEPEVTAGTRVWIAVRLGENYSPDATAFHVMLPGYAGGTSVASPEMLPDHSALKPTALELDKRRRRGEDAVALTMSLDDAQALIDLVEDTTYQPEEADIAFVASLRRQLDGQRGGGA